MDEITQGVRWLTTWLQVHGTPCAWALVLGLFWGYIGRCVEERREARDRQERLIESQRLVEELNRRRGHGHLRLLVRRLPHEHED